MISRAIELPLGELGLELEPVLIGGGSSNRGGHSLGCRVKGWKSDSSVSEDIKVELPVGSMVTKVDKDDVQKAPFHEVVEKISTSKTRCLTVSVSLPESTDRVNSSTEPLEASTPSSLEITVGQDSLSLSPADRGHVEELPAAEELQGEVSDENSKPNRLAISKSESSSILEQKKAGRARDGKLLLLSGRVQTQQVELQNAKGLITRLREDIDSKDCLLTALKNDVGELKNNGRKKDGKIALLSFQLRKNETVRQAPQNSPQIPLDSAKEAGSTRNEDIILHAGKWKSVMRNILSSSENTEDDNSAELRKALMINERINKRLEAKLHEWVDSQISTQKQLAAQEIEAMLVTDKDTKEEEICGEAIPEETLTSTRMASDRDSGASNLNDLLKVPANKIITGFPDDNSPTSSEPLPLPRTRFDISNENNSTAHASKIDIDSRRHSTSEQIDTSIGGALKAPVVSEQKKHIQLEKCKPGSAMDNTPIIKKMLRTSHTSKKRAISKGKDDLTPGIMDTSYEFINNEGLGENSSQLELSLSSDFDNLSLSVHALSPYPVMKTTGNNFMSPTIVKLSDQMNKLRGQNASIRSDLQKFRGIIQVSCLQSMKDLELYH